MEEVSSSLMESSRPSLQPECHGRRDQSVHTPETGTRTVFEYTPYRRIYCSSVAPVNSAGIGQERQLAYSPYRKLNRLLGDGLPYIWVTVQASVQQHLQSEIGQTITSSEEAANPFI